MTDDADRLFLRLCQLYGRQSFAIDEGNASEWAATFTEDGEFISPTYAAPVVGRSALEQFARAVHDQAQNNGLHQHHVITNTVLTPSSRGPLHCLWSSRAYLGIVTTDASGATTLTRLTTIEDELHVADGTPRIRRRTVRRHDTTDGSPRPADTH
jgi:hypothetical protein